MNPLEQLNALKLSYRARVQQDAQQAARDAEAARQFDEQAIAVALTDYLRRADAEWLTAFIVPREADAHRELAAVHFAPPGHAGLSLYFTRQSNGTYSLSNAGAPWVVDGHSYRTLGAALWAADPDAEEIPF